MPKKNQKPIDLDELKHRIDSVAFPVCRGHVTGVTDLSIEGTFPGACLGAHVRVETRSGKTVRAQIAEFRGTQVQLLPFESTAGIGPGDPIVSADGPDEILCDESLLGRIVDVHGVPLDGGAAIERGEPWPLERPAPDPLKRKKVKTRLFTGLRAIDGCLSLGKGQRVGLFAGPGLGKSTLLSTLARRSEAEISVICLVGERGREVREFVEDQLGKEGLKKSVLVLARADSSPLIRSKAIHAATAIAEWFRAKGRHVLLLVDSLTRMVRARRDIALAMGEAPTRGGFPAGTFSPLPALIERAGSDDTGSITAVYAVLTEGREDDVVAEETRSLLDGHIILSPKLASAGKWPAIDVTRSVSRVMGSVATPDEMKWAAKLKRLLSAYEENEDLILMGAYRPGTSIDTDLALQRKQEIVDFLYQQQDDISSLDETMQALRRLARE